MDRRRRPDRYGYEIFAENVGFLSRAIASENEVPNLVDREDAIEEGWYGKE